MELFARIIAIDTLRAGWDKVNRNAGGPGGDGVSLGEFSTGLDKRLRTLHATLLEGSYWPRPVRLVEVPKRRGGIRTLTIPAITDRVAQTAAALVLTPILDAEFEESSFGYRPGRSVAQAVRRVAALRREGYVWTVDGDIEAYFDSVPHDRMMAKLETVLDCPRTLDLIACWLEAHCPDDRGLPQGGPLSPLLANLYLDTVDERIAGKGVRLVRFADDFLLLCRSEAAAEGALERIADLLAAEGLSLDLDKTAIRRFEDATRFLGHLFVRGTAARETVDEEDGLTAPPPPARLGEALAEGEEDAATHAPRLRWLYVHEPGRRITARGETLRVMEGEAELVALRPDWADGIEIGPGAAIEDDALRLAIAERCPVRFLSNDGRCLASVEPDPAERAALHLAQADHVLDPAKRLDLARRIVAGRLHSQRDLLRRLNRRRKVDAVAEAAHRIGRLARLARVQDSPAEAMGVEGHATALYWPALGGCLEHGWTFSRRMRRPPPDAFNLLLSFLSTRLYGDMAALISRRGLHTGFAALHASRDGRQGLALDLMEAFRAPLVEGLAVYLVNNRIMKPTMVTPVATGGVRVSGGAGRIMVQNYERWVARSIQSRHEGRRTSWRGAMEDDVLAWMRHIRGDDPFTAHRMDN